MLLCKAALEGHHREQDWEIGSQMHGCKSIEKISDRIYLLYNLEVGYSVYEKRKNSPEKNIFG